MKTWRLAEKIRSAGTVTLLALVFSVSSGMLQASPPPLNVVLLSTYDLRTTRNRFSPIQQLLAEKLNRPVEVRPTNRFPQVEAWAQRNRADLVLLSANRGRELAERHHYRVLAQTFQPINLYVRRGELNAPFSRFRRIGIVRNTVAYDLARSAMPELSPGVHFVVLPHHTAALLALVNGEVDGIVANPSTVRGVIDNIARRVGARHSFGNVGSAVAAVSPRLAQSGVARTVQQLLLENGTVVTDVFQKSFGLGPFENPAAGTEPLEQSPSPDTTEGDY